MTAISRISDLGESFCPDDGHGHYTTEYVTGASTVFINNLAATFITTIGDQTCSHHSIAVTGSPTVFAENKQVHRIDDRGIGGGGDWYIGITGSPNVFNNETNSTANIAAPDTSIFIDPDVQIAATNEFTAYVTNPSSSAYYLPNPDNPLDSSSHQVKTQYPGTPDDGGQGLDNILPTSAVGMDIIPYLNRILQEANAGMWRETGVGGKPSNPNITGIWRNLGYPTTGMWASDQTAWCMGFVNYVLKNTGYHYVQTARAFDIRDRTSAFHATQIPINQAQPGDICLWSYSHVNFVFTNTAGKLTFVGGNQSDKVGNNPSNGSVTNSYPNGYEAAPGGPLISVYRPSKT